MQPTSDTGKRVTGTVASGWPGTYVSLSDLGLVGAFPFLRRQVLHRDIFRGGESRDLWAEAVSRNEALIAAVNR